MSLRRHSLAPWGSVAAGVWLLLAVPGTLRAQDTPHMERSLGGTLINQDYFTANQYPEVKATLYLVEFGHLNEEDIRQFNEGKYNLIMPDIKYTLDKFPNHPRAIHILCAISKAEQDVSAPIPFFERAIKLYPQHAYTHAQYGNYLSEIGAPSAGILELEEALRLNPDLQVARGWLLSARERAAQTGRIVRPQRAGSGKQPGTGHTTTPSPGP